MKMQWLRVSLIAQVILALYFQIVQWVPLGRWNFQPGFEPLAAQAFHGHIDIQDLALVGCFLLPALIFRFAWRKGLTWIMWMALLGYLGWLAMEMQTWWVSYIFGASDAWMSIYQRVFSQSIKILPSFGRHLAPDGMHLVLQMLLAIVTVSTLLGLLNRRRSSIQALQSKQ